MDRNRGFKASENPFYFTVKAASVVAPLSSEVEGDNVDIDRTPGIMGLRRKKKRRSARTQRRSGRYSPTEEDCTEEEEDDVDDRGANERRRRGREERARGRTTGAPRRGDGGDSEGKRKLDSVNTNRAGNGGSERPQFDEGVIVAGGGGRRGILCNGGGGGHRHGRVDHASHEMKSDGSDGVQMRMGNRSDVSSAFPDRNESDVSSDLDLRNLVGRDIKEHTRASRRKRRSENNRGRQSGGKYPTFAQGSGAGKQSGYEPKHRHRRTKSEGVRKTSRVFGRTPAAILVQVSGEAAKEDVEGESS